MTRTIKFRAWDGEKMCAWDDIKKDFSSLIPCEGDESVMQFTGLKDKNGVEIYEGDIVTVDDEYSRMFDVKEKHEIKFYCGSFNLGNTIKPLTYFVRAENTAESFMEVIGNIYQNPELLK